MPCMEIIVKNGTQTKCTYNINYDSWILIIITVLIQVTVQFSLNKL